MIKKIGVFLFFLALFACEKNPAHKLINPTDANAINGWRSNGEWVIYDDELKTGGTVKLFNSFDGQTLDLACRENPYAGTKCLKYSWDGRAVYAYDVNFPGLESGYVALSLIASNNADAYLTDTRDLSLANYTKISFYARGSLQSFVYLRLEGNNGTQNSAHNDNAWMSNTITTSWKKYEFSISGNMTQVKDFLKIILRYDEDGDNNTPNTAVGNGGTIYLDNIVLTR